jgi:membrane carboxypeptidase/penicillin-binding protein
VAVRIGFDDNRPLGRSESGGRTALPVFREIMLRIYERQLVGPAPRFPYSIENGIDQYVAVQAELKAARATLHIPSQGTRDQP